MKGSKIFWTAVFLSALAWLVYKYVVWFNTTEDIDNRDGSLICILFVAFTSLVVWEAFAATDEYNEDCFKISIGYALKIGVGKFNKLLDKLFDL